MIRARVRLDPRSRKSKPRLFETLVARLLAHLAGVSDRFGLGLGRSSGPVNKNSPEACQPSIVVFG